MTDPNTEPTLKAFGTLEVKDADKGEVEAIVATFNVVDRDHDVILPGALTSGAKVKISGYGHDAVYGEMPVGKGVLIAQGEHMVFKGRYFLNTHRGREAFATLKEMGADQEWSFGFKVVQRADPPEEWLRQGARQMLAKLAPFEVSPVMIGAGIGTQTVAVKEEGGGDSAAADAARQDAEALAATEAAAAEEARVTERQVLRKEAADLYDRFQRNLRRFRA